MKIELLIDLPNHKAGTVLNILFAYGSRMIKNGYAKEFVETPQIEKVEEKIIQSENIQTPKRKGNPNWAKK